MADDIVSRWLFQHIHQLADALRRLERISVCPDGQSDVPGWSISRRV